MSEAGEMGQALLYLAGELLRDSEKPAEDWIRPPPPTPAFQAQLGYMVLGDPGYLVGF